MPLVAGVDSSTSSCKVEIHGRGHGCARRLAAVRRTRRLPPPRSEQDPHDWWTAFEAACAQAGLLGRNRPAAISVAGQQHGLVVLDAGGAVLRPAKLWNDTESAEDADTLVAMLGAEAWAEGCGSVPVASFTITKLRWLKRCQPDVFRRVARVMLPHDWLTARLTGASVTDRGDASGTGWWSPREARYRYDLLALIDDTVAWGSVLPEVLAPTDQAGEWQGMVVGPGTGDNMAAALGLGLRPGDLGASLGTSGTAFCVSDRPTADPTGTVAGFADASGHYLPLVCTLNATKVTDAIARLLGVDAMALDGLALEASAGSGGLVLVPHLDGERTPNRPGATGALTGIRSDVTRSQLARAAVEGVVCNLLSGADELVRIAAPDGPTGRVMLIGGGAHSPAYRQVTADLIGREVLVHDGDELVARGAAMQAAAVLRGSSVDEVSAAWGPGRAVRVEPDFSADAGAVRTAYADAVVAARSCDR